jgi:hypothetical protein
MNHHVSLSLTNRKSSVRLHVLYSPRTAQRTFTPRRDQLVICGLYKLRSLELRHQATVMYIGARSESKSDAHTKQWLKLKFYR